MVKFLIERGADVNAKDNDQVKNFQYLFIILHLSNLLVIFKKLTVLFLTLFLQYFSLTVRTDLWKKVLNFLNAITFAYQTVAVSEIRN